MALYANPTDLRQILVAEKQTKPGDRYNFKMDHGQSLDVELGGESREKKEFSFERLLFLVKLVSFIWGLLKTCEAQAAGS